MAGEVGDSGAGESGEHRLRRRSISIESDRVVVQRRDSFPFLPDRRCAVVTHGRNHHASTSIRRAGESNRDPSGRGGRHHRPVQNVSIVGEQRMEGDRDQWTVGYDEPSRRRSYRLGEWSHYSTVKITEHRVACIMHAGRHSGSGMAAKTSPTLEVEFGDRSRELGDSDSRVHHLQIVRKDREGQQPAIRDEVLDESRVTGKRRPDLFDSHRDLDGGCSSIGPQHDPVELDLQFIDLSLSGVDSDPSLVVEAIGVHGGIQRKESSSKDAHRIVLRSLLGIGSDSFERALDKPAIPGSLHDLERLASGGLVADPDQALHQRLVSRGS